MTELVYLKCVKEGSKLRVKIISPGFFHEANCQFPRDIREEGRKYSVPLSSISFSEGPRQKFFYRVKGPITILNESLIVSQNTVPLKIFEDTTTTDCTICMSDIKDTVFSMCGHYVCCNSCSKTIFSTTKKCPICRLAIVSLVKRENIQI